MKDVLKGFAFLIFAVISLVFVIYFTASINYKAGDVRLKRTLPRVQYEVYDGTNWNEVK